MSATDPSRLKMYVLILDDVPLGHAVNSASHASLSCYLKYQDDPDMQLWLAHSFRKVCCLVNAAEFATAVDQADKSTIIRESSLDNRLTAVAFAPRPDWPESFKFFRLYGKHTG